MSSDTYTHGHADSVLRSHRWRTLENSAAYLIPHLDVDAKVLDVGCGPGTITAGLARVAQAGSVVGLDRSHAVLEEAALTAQDAGASNVAFVIADVNTLPFNDNSFDVVHAHQVLQHLSSPIVALREMERVCKPSGFVAVRECDYGAFTWWPMVPGLSEWLGLYERVARTNGGEPDAGRQLKSWALAAGFEQVKSSASVWCYSEPGDVAWWGCLWRERVTQSALADQATRLGFMDNAGLARLALAWAEWSSSVDAWFAVVHGEVLCRRMSR